MINSDIAKSTYTTVPGATEYAIGFEYYWNLDDTPQLFVALNSEELVYGVDYTISGDGLNVVLAMEPDEPATLIITRNVPFTQTSDYVIGRVDPDQIERDFDLAMMRTQQNKTTIDTAVDIVNDCVDEVSELKSDVEETIDDVEQAVRDAEAAAETAASYETRLSNVEAVIPEGASSEDLLALKSEVDLAANSGTQLRDKGVWYAKMDAATTPPSSAGVEGRNYADFTQVDGNGDPIIVIYTYTSGAWTQTETITPPAAYNGYLPITSKFWDIQEQAGQQGGLVLWSYSAKTFTPYPRIISTDGIAITNSTFSTGTLTNVITTMPDSPVAKTVTNKQYVDNAITAALDGYDTPELFDWKWRDATTSKTTWKLSDGNWINKVDAETAYAHLVADAAGSTSYPWIKLQSGTPDTFIRAAEFDETGADYPYAYANIANSVLTLRYSTSSTGDYGISSMYYDGPNAGALGVSATDGGTITAPTLAFETVAGTTVLCWVAADGHKIAIANWKPGLATNPVASGQDTAVAAIYTATGVAWYYILDTTYTRFKLPRSKHEHYGNRPVVGNGKSICYTNGSAADIAILSREGTASPATDAQTGAYTGNLGNISGTGWYNGELGLSTDKTKSGIISTPIEDTDQYKYLYFYVGA